MRVSIMTKPDLEQQEFDAVSNVRIDEDGDLILSQQNITITCPADEWQAYAVEKT